MDRTQKTAILDALRRTSEDLTPAIQRYDVGQLENAIRAREEAVQRFQELVERDPNAFSEADVESARESLRVGKRAFEHLLEIRRTGWTTATEMAKNQYVLRTIAKYGGNEPADPIDG